MKVKNTQAEKGERWGATQICTAKTKRVPQIERKTKYQVAICIYKEMNSARNCNIRFTLKNISTIWRFLKR